MKHPKKQKNLRFYQMNRPHQGMFFFLTLLALRKTPPNFRLGGTKRHRRLCKLHLLAFFPRSAGDFFNY